MFSRARGRYGDETALVRRRPFWGEAFPSTFPLGRHSSIAAPVSTRSSSSASQCRAGPAIRKRRSSRGRGNRLLPKVDDSVTTCGSSPLTVRDVTRPTAPAFLRAWILSRGAANTARLHESFHDFARAHTLGR